MTGPVPPTTNLAAEYIRTHRDRYTDAVLRERLHELGYPQDAIDAAFRTVTPPSPAGDRAGTDRRPRAVSIIVAWSVAAWLLVWVTGWIRDARFESPEYAWPFFGGMSAIAAATIGLVMLLSIVAIVRSGRLRGDRAGALVAILALPLILVTAIAGTCIVIFLQ